MVFYKCKTYEMREFQIVSGEKGSKKRGRRGRKKGGKWQNEHENERIHTI